MAEGGKNVTVLLANGTTRRFTNASVDTTTEGWLYITRLEVDVAPLSGVAEPIAGYRLDAIVGWEYEGESEDRAIGFTPA
jgi:hypothetical protein